MSTLVDKAAPVRLSEELPVKALEAFIRAQLPELRGEMAIAQFPSGASNLTYEVSFGDDAFILRRPPFGTVPKSAHDMLREAKVIQSIRPSYPLAPDVVLACDDHSVMGCDFYLMKPISGIIIRKELPNNLVLSESQLTTMCQRSIDALIDLHNVDIKKDGIAQLGKGVGYVERQVKGSCERFLRAKTDDVKDFSVVISWLQENQPKTNQLALIHNDFRLDNLVWDPSDPLRIIGVLDWEMATIGDPLMDLGVSLAYWVEAEDHPVLHAMRQQPSHLKGMMSRDEFVAYYFQRSGIKEQEFQFYYVFGLFRLTMIAQQIYSRYYHKQTLDKRFSGLGQVVNVLEEKCLDLIGK